MTQLLTGSVERLQENLADAKKETFSEFVPDFFRWIRYMSPPSTKCGYLKRNLLEIEQVFPQVLSHHATAHRG